MMINEYMNTKVVTITPDMAANWLKMNMKEQRNIQKTVVERYAKAMKDGDWMLTHQGIAFDRSGKLIDGQHRLNAIIRAGIPVTMNVTYGVERGPGEILSIDCGKTRTAANIIQMSGYDDPIYKGMHKYIVSYINHQVNGRNAAIGASEIVRYIDRHKDRLRDLYDIFKPNSGLAGGKLKINAFVGAALICAYYRGVSRDAIEKFVQVYCRNDIDGCEGYGVKHCLNIRDTVRRERNNRELFLRVKAAIRAFVENRKLLVVPRTEEVYPYYEEIDG